MQSHDARDFALHFHDPRNLFTAIPHDRGSSFHWKGCFPGTRGVHFQVDPSAVYLHAAPGAVADLKARLAAHGIAPVPVEGTEPYVTDWKKLGQPDAYRFGLRLDGAAKAAPEAVRATVLANATLAMLRLADRIA